MHDNNTVQQLSDALNELLNAYDKLKNKNTQLEEDLVTSEEKIVELQKRNSDLEDQIEQLTDTTQEHTSKIDTMLGRIKTILSDSEEKKEERVADQEEGELFETSSVAYEEFSSEKTLVELDQEEAERKEKQNSSEIDLGRMQSLLNGFNN